MTSLAEAAPAGPVLPSRSLIAVLEEQLIIPSYASSWAFATIAAHRASALPLQLNGPEHRRTIELDGETIRVRTVGRRKLLDPILSGLFATLPASTSEGHRPTWNPAHLRDDSADLVIAEVHRWMAPRFREDGWIIVPRTVRWHGEMATVPPRPPSKSLQANLAKLRKQKFSLVQGNCAGDWDEFYRTMVEPQALARHGSTAWTPSSAFLAAVAKRGVLHFVVEAGVRVAGICSIAHGDTVWFPLMGVREGDPQLLQRGASVAAIALPIEWARANNFRRIDLGRTGSFVNDGIQQYKRKWGFYPVPDPLSLVVAVRTASPAARKVFAREPVLAETATGLETYAGQIA
jgi:Acetyltransferase (GNAT) domain